MQYKPLRLRHVSIRVRDLDRSTEFYQKLLRFEPVARTSIAGSIGLGRSNGEHVEKETAIVLSPGLPAGVELSGVDHFAFEVPTTGDVDSLYQRARDMHARATQPRVYENHWQTFIFDPDGYKIEVFAHSGEDPENKAALVV